MITTAQRIKEALDIRNMKQTDLVEKTGIGKSSISTYISGEYNPKQKNLYKIAKALNVNEAWLMGLNVPMERDEYEDQNIITFDAAFDAALNFLENSNYKISISNDNHSDVIIKNDTNEILMHDYELVGRYLAVREKEKFVPEDIISIPNQKSDFTLTEYDFIQKYRVLDPHGKEMVNFTLQKEWERSTAEAPKTDNVIPMAVQEDANYASGVTEEEMTHTPQCIKEDTDYLAVKAAHNDAETTDEELEKMERDSALIVEMAKKKR